MADKNLKEPQFTVTDRRKFTFEGELREGHEHLANVDPDLSPAAAKPASPDAKDNLGAEPLLEHDTSVAEPQHPPAAPPPAPSSAKPQAVSKDATPSRDAEEQAGEDEAPPGPTAEESAQGHIAYKASAQRIDDLVRASDPGAPREPEIGFPHLVQTLYMGALMQMGAGTPQGEKVRVDIVGARQSIDMLDVLSKKTQGNITAEEHQMLDAVLFELRMAFVRLTQAISQEAAAGKTGAPPKPRIVR